MIAAQSSAPDLATAWSSPRHVAIIMDGNNRWARRQGLGGGAGHAAGERGVKSCVETAVREGVEVLTLFAFSSENWRRPAVEVQGLMTLFLQALQERVAELHAQGVRLRFIGDLAAFSEDLRQGMQSAMEKTASGRRLTLNIAVNYGGQWDMAQAALSLAQAVASGAIRQADLSAEHYAARLSMADLPAVDLLIRTGGEYRLSNFVLWQAAYAELYFTETLWPDFDAACFVAALTEYGRRERRFGRTSEQIAEMRNDA